MASRMWGKALALDCGGCCPKAIRCPITIKAFSSELVRRIDMVAYGEPMVVHFGTDNKAGYTLVQLIETSNITAHFSESEGAVFLDVFSCKDFAEGTVRDVVGKYFKPSKIQSAVHDRNIPELE